MLALFAYAREHLDYDSHKDVGQPVIEEDDDGDEVQACSKILCIYNLVENVRPAVSAGDDDDLKKRGQYVVVALHTILRIARFLQR